MFFENDDNTAHQPSGCADEHQNVQIDGIETIVVNRPQTRMAYALAETDRDEQTKCFYASNLRGFCPDEKS